MLLRDTTNSMDVLRQRYADSKHSSATTTASTPLTDLSLSNHEFGYNTTPTAGMTTFLPTLHSTPPMPTFQKPGMHPRSSPSSTPSSNFIRRPVTHINNSTDNTTIDTLHSGSAMSTSNPTSTEDQPTNSRPTVFARRFDTYAPENAAPKRVYIPHRSPETVDGYQLTAASEGSPTRAYSFRNYSRAYSTTPLIDRIADAPPLPGAWDPSLDRLMCRMDAAGYDHIRIVQKIREMYPQLGGVLTPSMIDRRLRQLDQDIEIDYWRAGMRTKDGSEKNRERVQTRDLQDQRVARESDRANAAREEQAEQDHSHSLQQLQGEQRHQDWSAMYGASTRSRDGAYSPVLRGGGGGESSSRSSRSRNDRERRPRTVTQDFLGGFRSHNG